VASPADLDAFLRGVRLFRDIAKPELVELRASLRERGLRRGQIVFRQNEPGDEMFLVRAGTVLVSRVVTGRVEHVIARLGPGEFFGEISLLAGLPRSATIQAETEAMLLVLDRIQLQRLIEQSPRAAAAFFQAMVQVFIARLLASDERLDEATRWGLEATGLDVEPR
jgi:CRP-like cAMP-binding protein